MVSRASWQRTCVGCRGRAPASELLRVVAIEHGTEPPNRSETGEAVFSVVPDPTRRRPGRGAYLHPDPTCLALAQRRRAFGRALRVTGVLDTGPLAEHVDARTRRRVTDEPAARNTDGGASHPGQQGRTTNMSTR